MATSANFRSDGNAVDVVTSRDVLKGDVLRAQGFQGVVLKDAATGEVVAIETAQREHSYVLGALTGAKGQVLYVDADGTLTNTASGNFPYAIVTRAKDANGVCWAKQLPQPLSAVA